MKQSLTSLLSICLLAGCATSSPAHTKAPAPKPSAVQLRSMQSRAFDTTDQEKTLRTVITTLLDLGFLIDGADADLGTVSGTKPDWTYLRMTVSVRPHGRTQLLVRASAQSPRGAVEDPQPYQEFFTALGQSMFLTAQEIVAGPAAGVPVPAVAAAPAGS